MVRSITQLSQIMKRKRKTEIIVERDQVLVARKLEGRLLHWCEACARQSHLVTVDEAAVIGSQSSRAVYQRAEEGSLHFTETPEGLLLICLNSLLD